MKEVKSESKGKILPRFQLRNWSGDDLRAFISNEQEAEELALQINKQVEKYAFDGVVMECGFPTFFQAFLIKLSQLLHQQNRQLIVVLPAILIEEHKRLINDKLFDMMLNYVDRFSLMTYDYSSHIPNGGPAAPIEWIMDNIEYLTNSENRHKLLIGLNMYAMSYSPTRSPEPLVMKTIIEKLSNDNRAYEEFNWDKESQEAWFIDIDKENGDRLGTIWLPTLRSIRNRLRLAKDYGVGVALWEVGQGLDYFFDLF
ncbi:glycoside hydrolase superfamily [Cokeromyces recurvatus]|uniref:glycoside hydrolase superfamily n=1 Tax=Cokeromyces recurvatus TaxID=90255 RepID=UPI0022207326|nr:glycoside hydrolase superfamily [Cokeromyces recurvatus]KAI7898962.1 glycoside hydrolase superfamily [Cokeromyces recurvatus]